ncbi:MAG: hypothetical protein LBL24_03795 [Bacteroidales bacterium]|nr:hypothetical protein [Bacteroidales bacterium]
MQHTIKSCFNAVITAGWILLFTSCENNTIDPLNGKYPEPENYSLNTVLSQTSEKGAATRTFTLELGDGSRYLSVEFTGNRLNYFLAPGNYTIANRDAAKAGNYVAGDATGGTWWVASDARLKLIDGTIFVELAGETYTIRGTVMLEDGSMIQIAYTGTIVFEADPPAFTYTRDVQKPYVWTVDNGATYTPVPGSQLNRISVLSEGIPVAYFEIVTEEDPASLAGTYPVSGEIRDANGAVVRGTYVDLLALGWGTDIIKGGSYFISEEGIEQFLFEGNLTITDNSGTLNFTSSDFRILDITTPFYAPVALPGVKSINYVDATSSAAGGASFDLFAALYVDLSLFGLTGYTVTLKVASPDLTVTVEQGAMGPTYTYTGSGQYVSFDFSRDAASLPEGIYKVVENGSSAVGDCLAGYPSLFGAGFMGTFVGNVTNGEVTEEVVTGGTVEVTAAGISFNLTTESGTISGSYIGIITLQ